MKKDENLGFICPYCGKNSNGKIIDTRPIENGRKRKRVCEFCNKQYLTVEKCFGKIWEVIK